MKIAILAAVAVACATQAAAETLCDQMDAFERASFSADPDQPRRHWVEFHRLGLTLVDRDLQCKYSSDAASAKFCKWLIVHPDSIEFLDRLPRSILFCRGFRFPDKITVRDWRAEIDLPSKVGRYFFFEIDEGFQIDQGGHSEPDSAIRLSTFAEGSDPWTDPLPPLLESTDVSPRADSQPR
jgi:hypothetical protein